MTKVRYYLDTEFIEEPCRIDLISIALVASDGREYYAVSSEFDESRASGWVVDNVFPHLPPRGERKRRAQIVAEIREFVGDTAPEFWAYFADYDWVVFCWLFGSMLDLPNGWPQFCMDLKQVMVERGIPKGQLPAQDGAKHDALADARWVMRAHQSIVTR